jgi:6-phosphogluconate dehydrogenase (decarboxylating)
MAETTGLLARIMMKRTIVEKSASIEDAKRYAAQMGAVAAAVMTPTKPDETAAALRELVAALSNQKPVVVMPPAEKPWKKLTVTIKRDQRSGDMAALEISRSE